MDYTGHTGFNNHYGYFLIGKNIGNNNYLFYVPPVFNMDTDYQTEIFRYAASDLVLKDVIDLNVNNEGDFIDEVVICDYMGLDYKPLTKLYIGSPTGKKRIATYKNDWSTMETANMLRVKQDEAQYYGFAFDNGLFADFKKNLPFNEENFFKKLSLLFHERKFPDFIVVPDVIGGGIDSLKFSVDYMPKLEFCPFPKYLVVQNGMTADDVEKYLCKDTNEEKIEFDGIFVGGTPTFKGFGQKPTKEIEWKIKTMEAWTRLAHKHGKKCHIGRVSSIKRLNFARSIKADSCDTSIVNFDPKEFIKYEKACLQTVLTF